MNRKSNELSGTVRKEIERNMWGYAREYTDPLTGEVDMTELAERWAMETDNFDATNEEVHEVWDAAYNVACRIEGNPQDMLRY
jgi:hypothetical protein